VSGRQKTPCFCLDRTAAALFRHWGDHRQCFGSLGGRDIVTIESLEGTLSIWW
jgi:hypothetical protein